MERTNFSEYKALISAIMLWQILFSGQQQEQFGFQDVSFMSRVADDSWSVQILIRLIPNIAAGSMSYTPFERHLWMQFPPRTGGTAGSIQAQLEFRAFELCHVAIHAVFHHAVDFVGPFEEDF